MAKADYTYAQAAAALAVALDSGNEQDALAAKAIYEIALNGKEPAEVELAPAKRALDSEV